MQPLKLNITKISKKGILDLAPYIPGKSIQEIQQQFGLERVVKLASNECPLEIPKKINDAIVTAIQLIRRYPEGYSIKLKSALADKLHIPTESILLGNGAEECLQLISQAILEPGDESLIPDLTFDAYRIASQLAGAKIINVPLTDYHINLDLILNKITSQTKIIWLCSPNNPTGTVISKTDFDSFLNLLPEDIVVVLDQAYWEYITSSDPANSIEYIKRDARVIGVRTFSKASGLAGLRIGYIIAHPAIVGLISKVKLPFNVNVLAQAAALGALQDETFFNSHLELIGRERKLLKKELEKRDCFVVDSETNFLFIKLPMDGDVLSDILLSKGIIIRPGSIFGMKNFIRVSIGNKEENELFLKKFDEVICNH